MADIGQDDILRGRFINHVLKEEGQNYLERQTRAIRSKLTERTGTLLNKRRSYVTGTTLTVEYPAYLRFLEIRKRTLRIYNRPTMRMYNRVAERLMNDFTQETQEELRAEIEAIRARFIAK